MPSVLVGQDCKYDRNFEALPVKEYLTQVLEKSYGAPEGPFEIHILLRSLEILLRSLALRSLEILFRSLEIPFAFRRNTFVFSRNTIAFSRNTTAF